MTKIFTLFAAAAVAATLIPAAPASAGGGVRLNFGYPLGNFMATRHSPGAVLAGSQRRSSSNLAAHKALAAKRAAAARKAEAAKMQAANQQAAAEKRRLAAKQEAAESRRKARKSNETTKVARNDEPAAETIVKSSPVKASAIAGAYTVLRDEVVTAPAEAIEGQTDAVQSDAEPDLVAEAGPEVVIPPVPTAAPDREVGCKRYIPSAGLTITVPCKE